MAERIVGGRHEGTTDRVHHERALRRERAASRIVPRQVDRPEHEVQALDLACELTLVPDVIAGGNDVGAGRLELAGGLGREAGATCGVLPVHDRKVDAQLVAELGQQRGHRVAARAADDVTDEQDAHLAISRNRRRASPG